MTYQCQLFVLSALPFVPAKYRSLNLSAVDDMTAHDVSCDVEAKCAN